MGLRRRQFFLVSGAAVMLTHCKTAGFKDVYLSTDSDGKHKTSTFPTDFTTPDSGIYCQISYSSGRDDAELHVYLIPPGYLDEENTISMALVDSSDIFLSKGDGQLTLQFGFYDVDDSHQPITKTADGSAVAIKTQGTWPEGDYQVQFFIDKKKEDSLNFTVAVPDNSLPG